ncbi:MAG TPA: lipoyl(octanoyl) transferase LipB [Xanthomonadaceae bacterium]|nr:lipoyl(octanoyl) transferase LipB [Xanthomonadaceae bacterium]
MDDLKGSAKPVSWPAREWRVRDLGRRAYDPVWHAMQAFTDARDEETPDELWIVEHEPVFTLGQAGKPEHILTAGNIPVLRVDRGGQVTYHGPGQIVAYPLVDLRRLRLGVRELVERIEQAVIDVLADWNIVGERKPGAPGIYVAGAKVMALGLRVRRGCSFHGLAFNVAMDLEPFQRINPCGYEGLQVTSVLDLGGPSDPATLVPALVAALSAQLGLIADWSPDPPKLLSIRSPQPPVPANP